MSLRQKEKLHKCTEFDTAANINSARLKEHRIRAHTAACIFRRDNLGDSVKHENILDDLRDAIFNKMKNSF